MQHHLTLIIQMKWIHEGKFKGSVEVIRASEVFSSFGNEETSNGGVSCLYTRRSSHKEG